MKLLRSLSVLLIVGLLFFSCSSDKKDSGTNQEEQPPQGVTIEPVQLPASMVQSSDEHAQLVVAYVNLLNVFQYWTNSLIPRGQVKKSPALEATTDGPPWVYTWTEQGLTVTLTITIENNQYHWVLTYSGSYEGTQYTNVKVVEAWQNMDGTSGSITLYDPETQSKAADWTWQKDDQGTVTIHFISYDDQTEIILVQKADLSGSIEVKENSVLVFKATWNGDGTGQWWTYENGSVSGSGTWG